MGLIKCTKCQMEVDNEMLFCPNCGSKLANQSKASFENKIESNAGEKNTADLLSKLNGKSSVKLKSNPPLSFGGYSFNRQSALKAVKIAAIVFLILGVIFLSIGFFKISAYENPDDIWGDSVNAYVGGDAYNYIINGTYFAAYAVMGTGSWIIAAIMAGFWVSLSFKEEQKND